MSSMDGLRLSQTKVAFVFFSTFIRPKLNIFVFFLSETFFLWQAGKFFIIFFIERNKLWNNLLAGR